MVKDITFQAEPKEPIKIGLDLKFPEALTFKFTISGTADAVFLRKLSKMIKANSQKNEQ